MTKEHRGTYFCVATNVVGTGARRNVDVEVTFAPLLKVQRYSIYILKKHKILCLTLVINVLGVVIKNDQLGHIFNCCINTKKNTV